jgi:hypothetical protein
VKKNFPVGDVLTVATGIMLANGSDFHGVMDHFCPGIMSIGCAAMQQNAADEIMRQHPKVREFCRVNKQIRGETTEQWCRDFLSLAKVHFGDTLELLGPHDVPADVIQAAFDQFSHGATHA